MITQKTLEAVRNYTGIHYTVYEPDVLAMAALRAVAHLHPHLLFNDNGWWYCILGNQPDTPALYQKDPTEAIIAAVAALAETHIELSTN